MKTFHPNQNHQPAQAVLENMLDCIPDAVLSSDRKGIITYCNEAFEVMFGYSRAELIGLDRRSLPILPAFDKDAQSSIYTRLAAGEAIYNYETVRLTRGGIPLDVSISMTPIREQGKGITGLTSVYKDITEHKRTQNAIQESEARYKLITSNMTEMIALLDNERRYLFVSPSYESKLGYRPEELHGQCADRFVYSEDALRFRKKLAETDTGMSHSVEYRHLKADGRLLWVELRLSVLASGGINRYLAVGRDISERKQLEEQMIHMSYYDTVTGAPNLYLFKDRLNEAVRTARRFYHGLALFYVSLDGFRKINTAYGYEAGNAVLKAVAERLMSGIREKGTVGRISGDEFTVYLHGIERKQDAVRIAERIADQLAEPFDLQGKAVPLTASIGIAVYPDDCLDSVALIDHAHAAMFRAKENGKGRWHLYDSD
ncbi:PAS domain S-box protein [Paenibacillus sp. CC-CFT747]|nr:PAS domain S-box protein [Paenibacillus sp. CC-CFT747]